MTEDEWLVSAKPWDMINVMRGRSDRKLRLFACACCRQVWNPFLPSFVMRVVEAVEAFADGQLKADALSGVLERVAQARQVAQHESVQTGVGYLGRVLEGCMSLCTVGDRINVAAVAQNVCHATARAAADVPLFRTDGGDSSPEYAAELAAQAELLRDIFGNPFRPPELRSEWLTSTVVALARGIYADYAFEGMPILADALQDAGCDDEGILSHCREPREHARGCWAVDLLLGKQ